MAAFKAGPAGLSSRYPWAIAHFMIMPIQPFILRICSGLVRQCGTSTAMTSCVETSATDLSRRRGSAYLPKTDRQSFSDFPPCFHPGRLTSVSVLTP